ncbi:MULTISPECIES: hypothetical protein [unclassified Mesorhizobium]|uniref:hypothetical protein n=1 Tax=unclassified Mesorhizobium TaxID=325217 RepID=UPI0011279FBE|nr:MULTISPECIES: hypothetical protein [unclassified Mesorhizobium]TPK42283.1 hypothetical protein FJ550_30065 [Mesorhizobium sp. B2-5-2]TPL44522.1 hypothetical protein FJ961_04075 [Mesorhizobium sp. B2-4-5]TPM68709.1 hypothetical protein FJ968_29880 [Mesorhizobium sp. B2-1-6]TPN71731.1 hypothetical protein FJ985_30570 [Mesorhizobium sp. B1-1-2]
MISAGQPITYDVKLSTVRALIAGKQDWLARFSHGKNKRPDHEIDQKRTELTVLGTIAEDYERAVEVTRAGAAE